MSERLWQITDKPQSLEGYLRTEDCYKTFTPELRRLVRRIDQEAIRLSPDERLIVFSYLCWIQTTDFVLIAHFLGKEEEEIKDRVNQIFDCPDKDHVLEATCRLIDHMPSSSPFKEKHAIMSPELREGIIRLRKKGTPNKQIAQTLKLKEGKLKYLLQILLEEGAIESRNLRGKKEGKESVSLGVDFSTADESKNM